MYTKVNLDKKIKAFGHVNARKLYLHFDCYTRDAILCLNFLFFIVFRCLISFGVYPEHIVGWRAPGEGIGFFQKTNLTYLGHVLVFGKNLPENLLVPNYVYKFVFSCTAQVFPMSITS